jgi:hypothetical protein
MKFKVYEAQVTPIVRVWRYEVEAETMKEAIRLARTSTQPKFVRDVNTGDYDDVGRSGWSATRDDNEDAAIGDAVDALAGLDEDDDEDDDEEEDD